MTANERSEMISRLRMAKDLREQMKIECELNSITMDEVTGSMAAAGIEVPGPKRKAGGHTPGAAEMDERCGCTLRKSEVRGDELWRIRYLYL